MTNTSTARDTRTLARWFALRTRNPLLIIAALLLAYQAAVLWKVAAERVETTRRVSARLASIIETAIDQRNRPMIETALALMVNEAGAKSAYICDRGKALIFVGIDSIDCSISDSLMQTVTRTSLLGGSDLEVVTVAPRVHLGLEAVIFVSVGILIVGIIIAGMTRVSREVKREIVEPIVRAVRSGFQWAPGDVAALKIQDLRLLADDMQRKTAENAALAEANAKLRAEAAVAKMTAMLAHDVRKPFSILKIGLAQIERLIDNPDGLRAYLPKVRDRVGEALLGVNGLISDVMDASTDRLSLVLEPVDLRSVVTTATEQAFGYASVDGINVVEVFKHEGPVVADAMKLTRVMTNIVSNARDAIGKEGVITIRSRDIVGPSGKSVEIAVNNTGSYIPPEIRDSVFDSFFTSGKRGGTGLGLAIARKVVEAHGGSIRCESDRDTGTTFVFCLPVPGLAT